MVQIARGEVRRINSSESLEWEDSIRYVNVQRSLFKENASWLCPIDPDSKCCSINQHDVGGYNGAGILEGER